MEEKRTYVAPSIESISISATESLANGACEPTGSIPPEICGGVAPDAVGDPMS